MIVQTNVFQVYDIMDRLLFLGVLTALLWYMEIKNLDEYLLSAPWIAVKTLAQSNFAFSFKMMLRCPQGISQTCLP